MDISALLFVSISFDAEHESVPYQCGQVGQGIAKIHSHVQCMHPVRVTEYESLEGTNHRNIYDLPKMLALF